MRPFLLAAACLWLGAGPALAGGDAANGGKIFNKCKACHTADAETNKTGPHLKGLIGRNVASVEGYTYSESMKEFAVSHPVWDEATFDKYIENPKAAVAKTKMTFPGLMKPEERADLIAYLKTKL